MLPSETTFDTKRDGSILTGLVSAKRPKKSLKSAKQLVFNFVTCFVTGLVSAKQPKKSLKIGKTARV